MTELPMLEVEEPLLLTRFTPYQGSTWTNTPEVALLLFSSIFCTENMKGCVITSLLLMNINLYLQTSN